MLGGNIFRKGYCWSTANGLREVDYFPPSTGLFFDKISSQSLSSSLLLNAVVVVVSPLNSLISDQIRRSTEGKIKATVLKVRQSKNSTNLELDYSETNATLLKDARYHLVFTHPESVLSCKQVRLTNDPFRR